MLLDSIKIRRLENGFTVRYHVNKEIQFSEPTKEGEPPTKGFGGERFVPNLSELMSFVGKLFCANTDDSGPAA